MTEVETIPVEEQHPDPWVEDDRMLGLENDRLILRLFFRK